MLHHDEGLDCEITIGNMARHMRALQPRHDHLLHLEADNGRGIFPLEDDGGLHQEGGAVRLARDAPDMRHAAGMSELVDAETLDNRSDAELALDQSAPPQESLGQRVGKTGGADVLRHTFDVVRGAVICQRAGSGIIHGE